MSLFNYSRSIEYAVYGELKKACQRCEGLEILMGVSGFPVHRFAILYVTSTRRKLHRGRFAVVKWRSRSIEVVEKEFDAVFENLEESAKSLLYLIECRPFADTTVPPFT